ncbi:MAG TPA: hypothetical protein VGH87_03780 [Polyangiaceae bacterium]|jgi:hypothetical protein
MLSTIFGAASRRARIDFAGTFAEIDGLFYARGLKASAIPPELAIARGRLGVMMATKAFEGERVLRGVVTHVSAAPLFESLSIVVHPKSEIDAPLLLADMRVLPNGVTRAFFDACGSTAGEFDALFRKPLSQTLDAAVASAVRRKRVPEWLDSVSAGAGAQVGAAPGRGHVVQHALVRYVERWLDGVERAGAASDASANATASRKVGDVLRANGRAGKIITRLFGADFAARYAGLVWNA